VAAPNPHMLPPLLRIHLRPGHNTRNRRDRGRSLHLRPRHPRRSTIIGTITRSRTRSRSSTRRRHSMRHLLTAGSHHLHRQTGIRCLRRPSSSRLRDTRACRRHRLNPRRGTTRATIRATVGRGSVCEIIFGVVCSVLLERIVINQEIIGHPDEWMDGWMYSSGDFL